MPLTQTEYRLLKALIELPGRAHSRDRLRDVMHEGLRDSTDRAVDSHIRNRRRKLEGCAPGVQWIRSVYGAGYRFELPEA